MKENKFNIYIFWIIMFLMPIHLISWDPITKIITMGCVGILLLRSIIFIIRKKIVTPDIIKKWSRSILFVILTAMLYMITNCPFNLEDISLIAIPLALTFSSYCLFTQDEESFEKYFLVFAIFSAICAVIILLRSGGFTIVDLYRENVLKNAVAPFFCQVGVLAFSFLLNSRNKIRISVYSSVFMACLMLTIVLRARTALGSLALASLILLYNKYRTRGLIVLGLLVLIAFVFWGDQISDVLYASIVGDNKDLNDVDSLSSGRSSRNELALDYINDNLLFGASANGSLASYIFSDMYLVPHIFVLYTLVKYGVIDSLGFLYIYWLVIKQAYIHYQRSELLCLGCLLIALIVSLAEYCSPFGPGTTYIITYLILGRTLYQGHKDTTIYAHIK